MRCSRHDGRRPVTTVRTGVVLVVAALLNVACATVLDDRAAPALPAPAPYPLPAPSPPRPTVTAGTSARVHAATEANHDPITPITDEFSSDQSQTLITATDDTGSTYLHYGKGTLQPPTGQSAIEFYNGEHGSKGAYQVLIAADAVLEVTGAPAIDLVLYGNTGDMLVVNRGTIRVQMDSGGGMGIRAHSRGRVTRAASTTGRSRSPVRRIATGAPSWPASASWPRRTPPRTSVRRSTCPAAGSSSPAMTTAGWTACTSRPAAGICRA